MADGVTEGHAKLFTSPQGKLLGVAIAGVHAGELIHDHVLTLTKGSERRISPL